MGHSLFVSLGNPRQTHQINVSAVGAQPASDTPSYFNMPAGLLMFFGENKRNRGHVLGPLPSTLIPSPEENFKVKKESFLPRNTGLQHQASTNKLSCNPCQVLGQPRSYTQMHPSDRSSTMLQTQCTKDSKD